MMISKATGFGVVAAFVVGLILIGDGVFSKRWPKPKPTPIIPSNPRAEGNAASAAQAAALKERDSDNRVIEGSILYEETIDGRTFAIQERTIAGNSVDEVNGLYYVVGTISSGVFTPQMNPMSSSEWQFTGYQDFTQSAWYRTYDEALAQIERMRPDDDPTDPSTHPSKPRPKPSNGGIGGSGSLGSGDSPTTASRPSDNPFPSGGSSGGVF